jgi:hypothetical protein
MASYICLDPQSRLVIEVATASHTLIMRDQDNITVRLPLTLAHMRQLGYHFALLYKEGTGQDCLPKPMTLGPTPEPIAAPTPRVRTRSIAS